MTKFPLSSQTAFAVLNAPPGPLSAASKALSVARRLPKSISSSVKTAVPACCISAAAVNDSSYVLVNLPVRKLKTCTAREGNDMVTKCEEFGENVMDEAIDLVFLN